MGAPTSKRPRSHRKPTLAKREVGRPAGGKERVPGTGGAETEEAKDGGSQWGWGLQQGEGVGEMFGRGLSLGKRPRAWGSPRDLRDLTDTRISLSLSEKEL